MNHIQTRGYKCIRSIGVDGGNQIFEAGNIYAGIPLILLELEGIDVEDYFAMTDLSTPIDMVKQSNDFWDQFFKQMETCKC